jgi:hypothetical protein
MKTKAQRKAAARQYRRDISRQVELDHAEDQARRIAAYYHERGDTWVVTWVESIKNAKGQHLAYGVRSNIAERL